MPFQIGNGCLPAAISDSRINQIARSDTSPYVSVWERIKAFFCSTNKPEALELIRQICHPPAGTTRREVIGRFEQLRTLAYAGFEENVQSGRHGENHFCILDENSREMLSVTLDDAGKYTVTCQEHQEVHNITPDIETDYECTEHMEGDIRNAPGNRAPPPTATQTTDCLVSPAKAVSPEEATDRTNVVRKICERILSKNELMPGDILLLKDNNGASITHKIIVMGQKFADFSLIRNNKGDSHLVHALLWTKNQSNPPQKKTESIGEPETSECRGGASLCVQNTALRKGIYKVYRPDNSNLGDWAAQIAMMWGSERNIPYSKLAAGLSILKNSTQSKKQELEISKKYKGKTLLNGLLLQKSSFCSQHIISAYQAASVEIGLDIPMAMRVTARNTSVRTLDHFLKTKNGFENIGIVLIRPDNVD